MAAPSASPVREVLAGALHVRVYANRAVSGAAAASDFIAHARDLLASRAPHGRVRVIFAAAPSQGEMLATLVSRRGDLEWSRIDAFHMDEYINLPRSHPAGFAGFLRRHVWDAVAPGSVHELDGSSSAPDAGVLEQPDAGTVTPPERRLCSLCVDGSFKCPSSSSPTGYACRSWPPCYCSDGGT